MSSPRPVLPLLAVGVTLVLWASAFVAIRHLGGAYSPGALALGRLLVGSLALGALLTTRAWTAPTRREWGSLVVVGLLWFGLYNVALNAGERLVDAGTAALLVQLAPVLVAVLAATFLGERATASLGLGLLVALAGVVVIATAAPTSGDRDPVGVLLCLVSAAAYAVSLVLQKPLVRRLPPVQVTWIACTVGLLACLPFAGQLVAETSAASVSEVGWVVYLGVFPTAVAFSTYAFALSHMDAGRLSVTTYLVPPITVLISWAALGEAPPALAYLGGALALAGVAITRARPHRGPGTLRSPATAPRPARDRGDGGGSARG